MDQRRTLLYFRCFCVLLCAAAACLAVFGPGARFGDSNVPQIGDLLHGDVASMSFWCNGRTTPIEDTEKIQKIMRRVEQIMFVRLPDNDKGPTDPGGGSMYILNIGFTDGSTLKLSMPTVHIREGEYEGAYHAYIGKSPAIDVIPWPKVP